MMVWVADALVLTGCAVITLAVVGLIRRRRFDVRLYSAGQAVFLGVGPILVAAMVAGPPAITARAVLVGAFLLLSTPLAVHAMALAAARPAYPRRGQQKRDPSKPDASSNTTEEQRS